MLSLLIIAVIVFALVQRHRCRRWIGDCRAGRIDTGEYGPDYGADRWSRRFEHDSANRWLRETTIRLFRRR